MAILHPRCRNSIIVNVVSINVYFHACVLDDVALKVGTKVQKYGCTTDITTGDISEIDEDGFFVFSDNDEVPFCQIVDSGSQVIVREENSGFSAIGVISKGSTHGRTYCVRLKHIRNITSMLT